MANCPEYPRCTDHSEHYEQNDPGEKRNHLRTDLDKFRHTSSHEHRWDH